MRLEVAHRLSPVRPYRVVAIDRQLVVRIERDQYDTTIRVDAVTLEPYL